MAPSIDRCLGSGLLTATGVGVRLLAGLPGVLQLGSSTVGSELLSMVGTHTLTIPLAGTFVEELKCTALTT